jgi:lipid-A-disaccharide synthase
LADTEVMPEYLTAHDVSGDLAGWAERWLGDPTERERASLRLAYLREAVAIPGASERAADAIVEALGAGPSILRGPHGKPGSPSVGTESRGAGDRLEGSVS